MTPLKKKKGGGEEEGEGKGGRWQNSEWQARVGGGVTAKCHRRSLGCSKINTMDSEAAEKRPAEAFQHFSAPHPNSVARRGSSGKISGVGELDSDRHEGGGCPGSVLPRRPFFSRRRLQPCSGHRERPEPCAGGGLPLPARSGKRRVRQWGKFGRGPRKGAARVLEALTLLECAAFDVGEYPRRFAW